MLLNKINNWKNSVFHTLLPFYQACHQHDIFLAGLIHNRIFIPGENNAAPEIIYNGLLEIEKLIPHQMNMLKNDLHFRNKVDLYIHMQTAIAGLIAEYQIFISYKIRSRL